MSELPTIRAGAFISAGGRSYQEDRLLCVKDMIPFVPESDPNGGSKAQLGSRSLYAVFDGHGGSLASGHLGTSFHTILAANESYRNRPTQALESKSTLVYTLEINLN